MNEYDGLNKDQRKKRWVVVCDDESCAFATRAAAREYAGWLRRHPGNKDIRRYGPYRNANGLVYIRG